MPPPPAVFAEHTAQDAAALADRHVVRQGGLERRHQVVGPPSGTLQLREMPVDRGPRSSRAKLLQSSRLRDLVALADLHDLDRRRSSLRVAVYADHDAVAGFDPPLRAIR